MSSKYINFPLFYLKYHHRYNQMLQFWCADGSESEGDKEELIKVEAMSINFSDSSGYEYVLRVILSLSKWKTRHDDTLIMMWKT